MEFDDVLSGEIYAMLGRFVVLWSQLVETLQHIRTRLVSRRVPSLTVDELINRIRFGSNAHEDNDAKALFDWLEEVALLRRRATT
jgi:hypothetical protein